MAKSILGIDVGYDSLKLALVSGKNVKKTVQVSMPDKLIREGRTVSPETLGELLRTTMRTNGIHCSRAAVALPNETVFVRNVNVPQMTADQLLYNLPFEFRDYITEELKDYAFDYATLPEKDSGEAAEDDSDTNTIELLAVAAPVTLLEETKDYLRKAGLKLVKAAPAVCAYIELIRKMDPSKVPSNGEFCILDLGYQSIRMYMFKGERHEVTRVLEIGMSSIDNAIADAYNVDVHLAHTYLISNFEDCQSKDVCMNAFNNIAVELMRALNFYRFSNPDSQLADIWLCGGGAAIDALCKVISDSLDMTIHSADELLPSGNSLEDSYAFAQAVGITLG